MLTGNGKATQEELEYFEDPDLYVIKEYLNNLWNSTIPTKKKPIQSSDDNDEDFLEVPEIHNLTAGHHPRVTTLPLS